MEDTSMVDEGVVISALVQNCDMNATVAADIFNLIQNHRPVLLDVINVVKREQAIRALGTAVRNSLFDELLESCDIQGIMKIATLSHQCREIARHVILRRVLDVLRGWVQLPNDFRNVLRNTGSIVSGSAALQLCIRNSQAMTDDWVAHDLDVYAPRGKAESVAQYLKDREGYLEDPLQTALGAALHATDDDNDDDKYDGNHITRVLKLFRSTTSSTGVTTRSFIDVIEVQSALPQRAVFRFHNTFLINWFTADNIFMAYPVLTLQGKGVFNNRCVSTNSKLQQAEAKYTNRGMVIHQTTQHLGKRCGAACPLRGRSTKDVRCLEFNYDQSSGSPMAEILWILTSEETELHCHNKDCEACFRWEERKDGTRPDVGPRSNSVW